MRKITTKISTIVSIKVSSILVLTALLLAGPVYAKPITSPAEAVYFATEQRVLGQEATKYFILSGLGVRSRKADQALADAILRYESQHSSLSGFLTEPEARQQLDQVAESWRSLKALLIKKPAKSEVMALYSANEALISDSTQLIKILEQTGLSRVTPMLDLVGEQALLCQRISALYGMMAWGFEAESRAAFESSFVRFNAIIKTLQPLPENTPLINHNLKLLARQSGRTKNTAAASPDNLIPGLIDRSVVNMLKQVAELQGEYLILARTLDD